MIDNYLLIHKSILPENFGKVLHARHLLDSGAARDVSHAARLAGISRSTYYKYKDYILEPSEMSVGRKAVLSVLLAHEHGMLSSLLARISDFGGSVLTITQSLPIHGKASVTISLDVSSMEKSLPELLRDLESIPGVDNPRLVAVE